jgi:type II secretory pathway pseudopilin PulG
MLIVITIIVVVSVVALPVVLPAFNHRQVSDAARIVQGAIVGARDRATHGGRASGIRLLPDPAFQTIVTDASKPNYGFIDPNAILAANRIIPLDPAPDYSEGLVRIDFTVPLPNTDFKPPLTVFQVPYPGQGGGIYSITGLPPAVGQPPGAGVLMIEEAIAQNDPSGSVPIPNAPTSWYWNIRVGDKLQINNAGIWYTVVGPMIVRPADGNPEAFVNVGPPDMDSPLTRGIATDAGVVIVHPEFLLLVNGRDDNHNGWIDEGWDGVDNDTATLASGQVNPGSGIIDDVGEWEVENWASTISATGIPASAYTIRRRPAPSANAREVSLPTDVVIDLTTAFPGGTRERSRMPIAAFNPYTGYVDIMVNPDGTVLPTTIYSSPTSFDMTTGSFVHLWLAERGDLHEPSGTTAPTLPIPEDALKGATVSLKGDYRLVTLFSRTGSIESNSNMPFLFDPGNPNAKPPIPPIGFTNTQSPTTAYNVNNPFVQAQQGIR